MGATLTVIWWRDIPAQVVAKDGRRASKIVLHPRFQVAIDKAASQGRPRDMRRLHRRVAQDPARLRRRPRGGGDRGGGAARGRVRQARLAELIQAGGVDGGRPAAADETPGRAAPA